MKIDSSSRQPAKVLEWGGDGGAGFSAHEQNTRRMQAQKIAEGIMYQSRRSGWKGIFSRHAILRHNDEFWKYRINLAAAGIVRLILHYTITLTNFCSAEYFMAKKHDERKQL
jgi:hypothetical protein